MVEEVELTADEIVEQATGYWLIATNNQSTLVQVVFEGDCASLLNCACHLNLCASEAMEKVNEKVMK